MAAKDIEAAVYAAQLYIGKGLRIRFTDELKLYNRMNKKIAAVAKRRGIDEADAHRQIMGEAKRRGAIMPMPGIEQNAPPRRTGSLQAHRSRPVDSRYTRRGHQRARLPHNLCVLPAFAIRSE